MHTIKQYIWFRNCNPSEKDRSYTLESLTIAGSNKSARACQVGQGQVQEEEVFKGVSPTLKPIHVIVVFDMNRVI